MTQLVNPKIKVVVSGTTDTTIEDLYMDFDISKDREEEPNEAILSIYNLNADTRHILADDAQQYAPIEIFCSPAGIDEYVSAFKGEVEAVTSRALRPGYETTIECTSQSKHHSALFVDTKTFVKGTPYSNILNFFIDKVGLPKGAFVLPVVSLLPSPIKMSKSYSGPAFQLLQTVAYDAGLHVWINDGALYISDIYDPGNLAPKTIDKSILLAPPIETKNARPELIQKKSIAESTKLMSKAARSRKKTRQQKIAAASGYVDYEAVDVTVKGIELECILQPDIQPDDMILTNADGYTGKQYRVYDVNHYGNNEDFSDWTTKIAGDIRE